MFIGAAHLLHDGGNPYDHLALYHAESSLMAQQHLSMTPRVAVVRVGNPPLFFWALEPLAMLPFATVGFVWVSALFLLSLAGALITLRYAAWRAHVIPLLYFALMPPVILGAFYGNVIGLVFFALAAALPLLTRMPFAAGALLAIAWLKPPVALPLVLLMVLFLTPRPWRVAAGFVATSALLLALTLVATGAHSLIWWLHGLLGYSQDMGIQPDVASLSGLYVRIVPTSLRLGLEIVSLGAAAAVTAAVWWRRRSPIPVPMLTAGWLWFAWLLATPYAHFFDLILLTPPVVALLGSNGARAAQWAPAGVLYLMFVALFFINPVGGRVYLLPLPVLAAGYLVYRKRLSFQA